MSRFLSTEYARLTPYTPGEQPQDRSYIKLNTNESPYPPSPVAQRLAREAAGDLQLYSDPQCRQLVSAAAEYFGIHEDQIMFTNGSDDALNFAFMAFCDERHPVIFPDVTYGFYSVFAELNGIPCRELPVNADFCIDPKDYIGAGCNIFIANPNALTGIALPADTIEEIVKSNPDNVVVVDEAYVDFGGESVLKLIDRYDNLIVVQTFSKSRSLAGARLGFAAGCAELIRDLNTIRFSTNPYNINRMTMAAGIGALADDEYFRDCCAKTRAVREYTVGELKKLGFEMTDSSANFLLIRTGSMSGEQLYLSLKERGVLIRHFNTPRLSDYNRVTIGSREQMDIFIDTVKELLGK